VPDNRNHEIVLLETSSQVNKGRGDARKLGLMIVKPGFRPRQVSDRSAGVVELVEEWDPVSEATRGPVRKAACNIARAIGFTELVYLRWEPAEFKVRL